MNDVKLFVLTNVARTSILYSQK